MNSKNLFLEIEHHLLKDDKPSLFLNQIRKETTFKDSPFNIFNQFTDENKDYITMDENNIWNHTLNVVDLASKYKYLANNQKAFMWAALFHDVGKIRTLNPIHDRIGGEITRRILREVSADEILNKNIVSLVKHHSAPTFILNRVSYSIIDLINTADIHDVALLSLCNKIATLSLKDYNLDKVILDSNKFLEVMSSKTSMCFEQIIL